MLNPIKVVTFVDAESVLADYLDRNTSISFSEKAALTTLIRGLITDGLWDKVSYFYPCLGDNVEDCLLNVIDAESDDVFSKAKRSLLTMNDRTLQVKQIKSADTEYVTFGSRFKSLDLNDIGTVSSIKMNSLVAIYRTVAYNYDYQGSYSPNLLGLSESGDGNTVPSYNGISVTTIQNLKNDIIEKGRIMYGCQKDNELLLYANGVKATKSLASMAGSTIHGRGTVFNYISAAGGSNKVDMRFYAITTALTEGEWAAFNSRLERFLTAVGKG